jgi:hypothetical protein
MSALISPPPGFIGVTSRSPSFPVEGGTGGGHASQHRRSHRWKGALSRAHEMRHLIPVVFLEAGGEAGLPGLVHELMRKTYGVLAESGWDIASDLRV